VPTRRLTREEGDPVEGATSRLLRRAESDPRARTELFGLLYAQLRSLAVGFLERERRGHTLQPTDVVHEAWIRLTGRERISLASRGDFLALAAQAMRRVLVDYARTRNRDKRGGRMQRIDLELRDLQSDIGSEALDLLDVDRALTRLQAESAELARLVELRFFAGLSLEEIAESGAQSRNTLGRRWRVARALLSSYLEEPPP